MTIVFNSVAQLGQSLFSRSFVFIGLVLCFFVLANTKLRHLYRLGIVSVLLINCCWLLINLKSWSKNANHFDQSIFTTGFNVAWLTHSQRLCSSAYGALQICLWYNLANDTKHRHSYYGRRIGTRTRSIKWCHFQWPWTIRNPDFKVTPFFDAKYLANG